MGLAALTRLRSSLPSTPPPKPVSPANRSSSDAGAVLVCGSVVTEKDHQRIGIHFAVTSPCVEPPPLCYQALTSLVADTIFPSLPRCSLAAASYQLAQCFCFEPVGSSRPSGDPLRGWGDSTFHYSSLPFGLHECCTYFRSSLEYCSGGALCMRLAYSISPEGGSQPHPAGTGHANPLGPQNPLSTTVAHTSPQVAILSPLHCP